MKRKRNINLRQPIFIMRLLSLAAGMILISFSSCKDAAVHTSVKTDPDILNSYVAASTDSLSDLDFIAPQIRSIQDAMKMPVPVMKCRDTMNTNQIAAEQVALKDSLFTKYIRNAATGEPYRNEIFNVYPARESDLGTVQNANLADCYRVEMYNYTLNLTTTGIADIRRQKIVAISTLEQTQPEIPAYLKALALKIAVNSPQVQQAYGIKPSEKDALMANTKTSLNRTRCERSRHLCVAPTFVKEGKALWAIVDLTEYKLVGVRWTNTGTTGSAAILTERKLQDDKITACFCEKETTLEKDGWKLNYMLTSSDGLRVAQVSFNGQPVLQSAKLVDWHVSYSGTDGFGYSDAVGCPYFSQAAVIAFETPKLMAIKDDAGNISGFALEQVFRSELWPRPCNYNYRQRFEFYKDGRFRVAAASIGRGCGNDGTYRPVFRIAFAAMQNNFSEWNGNDWSPWQAERWQLQSETTPYTPEGYEYKFTEGGNGYYVEPGNGKFNDGGRGDHAYVFVTENKPTADEGEADLVTIGPCCNTDFHQGPEKFIGDKPDNIQNKKLVLWYVAQLKNDDSKGREYCWAESVLENGIYVTKAYPCFAGPMFVPVNLKK